MKVFISIKYHPDNRNRDLITHLSSVLEKSGLNTLCVIRDIEQWGQVHYTPAELMHKTFEAIDLCDLMVVELTEKGVGIGIEAGYAYARHKPIFLIAKNGSDISTTLKGISQRIFLYDQLDEVMRLFS